MRRFAVVLAAAVLAAGVAAARPEAARAQDNAAVAVNLKDGAAIFRFAFKIARVNKDVVDATNAAVAFASCEACETVAVAIQVVLIFSDPEVVTPTNLALALNYECTACETLASAYQFVLTTGGPVHFTAEGNRRIAEIRKGIRDLLKSGQPITELQPQLDVFADQLRDVIATELVAAGKAGEKKAAGEETQPEGETTGTTEPTESGTTGTTGTTEPETTGTTGTTQ